MPEPFRFCPRCATALVDDTRGGRVRRVCPACTFVDWDNPTPVVAALVEHQGDVILVRNHGWPETWYGLVTGFLERDESPEAGILREVEEELGLSGEIVEPLGNFAFPPMHQVILAYHVRAEGTLVLGEELADYKRVPPQRLRPWPLGTGEAVAEWLRRRATRSASEG